MLRGCHEIKISNFDYLIFARKKRERGKTKGGKGVNGGWGLKRAILQIFGSFCFALDKKGLTATPALDGPPPAKFLDPPTTSMIPIPPYLSLCSRFLFGVYKKLFNLLCFIFELP